MTLNIKNMALAFGAIVGFGLFLPFPVMAQYYSQSGQNLGIVVDKKVSDVTDPMYFDNISAAKKIFREGSKINFQITIENSGNSKIENIKLIDYIPNYLQVINGFSTVDNKQMSTIIDSLDVGQTKTYNIIGVIANTPVESYINQKWQLTNKVCVSNDKVSDCDNASYFVGGKVMPSTGNESIVLYTIVSMGISLSAVGLKRLIRGF